MQNVEIKCQKLWGVLSQKRQQRTSGVNFESLECFLLDNLDWFKGKCAGPPKKNHGKTMEKPWFPLDFPPNQSSDVHFSAKKKTMHQCTSTSSTSFGVWTCLECQASLACGFSPDLWYDFSAWLDLGGAQGTTRRARVGLDRVG